LENKSVDLQVLPSKIDRAEVQRWTLPDFANRSWTEADFDPRNLVSQIRIGIHRKIRAIDFGFDF
jgi:hypothetical protein